MSQPTILMYGWEFPPYNSGGLGVACYGLSRALARKKVKITFVLPQKIPLSADFLRVIFAQDYASYSVKKKIRLQNKGFLLYPYITQQDYQQQYQEYEKQKQNFLFAPDLYSEVQRYALNAQDIAHKEKFDIIHAHDWLSFLAGVRSKEISGKPLVVHVHATELDRTGNQGVNQLVWEIEKEGLEKADKVVAVSNMVKENLIQHYAIPEKKIEVVYNGIEEEDYTKNFGKNISLEKLKKAGNKIVLFLGRLTIQKGPDYFIQVAKLVLYYDPHFIFVVAGSGDMEKQMIDEVARLGIADKVMFTGFLRGKEWSQVFKEADMFVMPSVSEPFGLVALESMINGTPVLLSKQSGASEVTKNVLKVDFWDVDEMANKILSTLNNQGIQKTLKKEGFEEVRNINWRQAADRCITIYNQLKSN